MPTAIYTPEAIQDLEDAARYISADNLSAALRWLDAIKSTCELIAEQPDIGERLRTKRFGEVRRHTIGQYLVYYQSAPLGVEILRVLHGARDQMQLV